MSKKSDKAVIIERVAPVSSKGIYRWMMENLFSSTLNIILTVLVVAFLIYSVPPFLYWLIFNANYSGDADVCRVNPDGACWNFIAARFSGYMYGFYDADQRWRINIAILMFVIGMALILIPWLKIKPKLWITGFMLLIYPVIAWWLFFGGDILGLPTVPTNKWGGFTITLIAAISSTAVAFPFGILLALGRRSNMPAIKSFCIIFIEFWRGIPLITVLFVSAYILPLFFPLDFKVDQLLRALIGITMFSGAYLAEVIRGGLQAMPKGQYEAASALGLSYSRSMIFIILPQTLKISIPGIVNSFIGLFKDTTLLLIINLLDILGMVQSSLHDAKWSAPSTGPTAYIFAALFFWVFCFGMSIYSKHLEKRFSTGHVR